MSLWDWEELKGDLAEIRQENETSIILRRDGSPNLSAQNVRIARTGSSKRESNEETRDVHMNIVILGDENLDIQTDDRFDYEGVLYRVKSVRPHWFVGVRAEAEKIE